MSCTQQNSTQAKRNLIGGVVGNILEWYDFAVFGYFAPILGAQFFPSDDSLASTLNAFGVFAAGYVMRPLGGVLFGHFGDRLGRKRALELSVFLMAIPTTLVGLLPTHSEVGVAAAVLLVALRLFQGLSVGGEYIGSIAFLAEIAPPNRRGLWGSLTSCSSNAGLMLGSAVAAVSHYFIAPADLQAWGWRVPFLLGIVVGAVGLWLRRGLTETEQFEALKEHGGIQENPVMAVLRSNPGNVARLVGLLMLFGGGFYTVFVWWPTYLSTIVKPPIPHALFINTICIIVIMGLAPMTGLLSDLTSRRAVMVPAILGVGIAVYPLIVWTDHGSFAAAMASQLMLTALLSGICGPLAATMAEMFHTRHRYSGVAIAYNTVVGFVGGTAPLVCTWLIARTGAIAAPAYYLIFLAVVSLCAAVGLKSRGGDILE